MVFTLIGFSGSGKSHLASSFAAECGWTVRCCDTLIEERLAPLLDSRQTSGTRRVAAWLGLPSSESFTERQATYLETEQTVMRQIQDELEQGSIPENTIIDTTGSVIYMPEEILKTLFEQTKIFYLQIPAADEAQMFAQFIRDPKPIVWKNHYQQRSGESSAEALERAYPKLLHERSKLYEKYAHEIICAGFADRPSLSPERLLKR